MKLKNNGNTMNIHNSYFAITNPLTILDRWLHPYQYNATVLLRDKNLLVSWTKRADQALRNRSQPLFAEMQLYFSCVVKKRVLFHDTSTDPSVSVNPNLAISFRAVPASSCSPEEFARNYPIDGEFDSQAAKQMRPSQLNIDFKNQQWVANFRI